MQKQSQSPLFRLSPSIRTPLSPRKTLYYCPNCKNRIQTSKTIILVLSKLPTQTSIMSDKREAQDKPLITLRNAEDYPTWKSYTISRLQQQSCDWAITERPQPNLEPCISLIFLKLLRDRFYQWDIPLELLFYLCTYIHPPVTNHK